MLIIQLFFQGLSPSEQSYVSCRMSPSSLSLINCTFYLYKWSAGHRCWHVIPNSFCWMHLFMLVSFTVFLYWNDVYVKKLIMLHVTYFSEQKSYWYRYCLVFKGAAPCMKHCWWSPKHRNIYSARYCVNTNRKMYTTRQLSSHGNEFDSS